jgi:hypothetical protein
MDDRSHWFVDGGLCPACQRALYTDGEAIWCSDRCGYSRGCGDWHCGPNSNERGALHTATTCEECG